MITIIAVRKCKYVRADNSIINCEAQFGHLGDSTQDWLSFSANPNDSEEHGRTLFANAVNGDYGDVAAYTHPSLEYELYKIRRARNSLIADTDFYGMPDVTMSDAMTTYRQALRDITNGIDTAAKARAVTYPTKPS